MELPLFEVPFLAEVDLPGTIPALSIWFSLSTSSRVDALATASRMALASSADGPPLKEKKSDFLKILKYLNWSNVYSNLNQQCANLKS